MKKRAVIVLPAYNERENIKTLVPAIVEIAKSISNWDIAILVADDSSPDKTAEEVERLKKIYASVHLITGQKEGLGKAYRRGFSYALEHLHPDILFEMDADWQHDPHLIPQFLQKIDDGADFVIGSRFIKGGSIPAKWEWYRKIFSVGANLGMRFGFMKFSIHDWTSGYRAINADFLRKTLDHYTPYDGYIFQIAILDNAVKEHLHIAEVPLNFADRKVGTSKIPAFQYIVSIILYVLTHSSFIKFAIVGVIGAVIDFGFSYLLHEIILISIVLSTIISGELSLLSNFFINNYWSFAHRKISTDSSHFWKALAKFHTVAVGSIAIQAGLIYVATSLWNPHFWYIYKIFIIGFAVLPYSYFMYNKIIWKPEKKV
ncbi:MAG: glycosyltransferase [Candidatus Roizmanbacteria bacterium]